MLFVTGMSRRGKSRGPPGSKSFVTALKGCQDKFFIDFIRRSVGDTLNCALSFNYRIQYLTPELLDYRCLEWEPEKRLTPAQALRHAWLRRRLPRPPHDDEPHAQSHAHANSQSHGHAHSQSHGHAQAQSHAQPQALPANHVSIAHHVKRLAQPKCTDK